VLGNYLLHKAEQPPLPRGEEGGPRDLD
jgi:hypothetical protein